MPDTTTKIVALLYPGIIPDDMKQSVKREKCYSITEFSYQCTRSRNEEGIPYGSSLPSTMEFTFKLEKKDDANTFYSDLCGTQAVYYSFLFDVSFITNENPDTKEKTEGGISSYKDSMLVKGFIVDIKDDFDNSDNPDAEQILVSVKLLISAITFKSDDNKSDRKLLIF